MLADDAVLFATDDGALARWQPGSSPVLLRTAGADPIIDLDADPAGRRLATGSRRGEVLMWDLAGGSAGADPARRGTGHTRRRPVRTHRGTRRDGTRGRGPALGPSDGLTTRSAPHTGDTRPAADHAVVFRRWQPTRRRTCGRRHHRVGPRRSRPPHADQHRSPAPPHEDWRSTQRSHRTPSPSSTSPGSSSSPTPTAPPSRQPGPAGEPPRPTWPSPATGRCSSPRVRTGGPPSGPAPPARRHSRIR